MTLIGESGLDRELGDWPRGPDELAADEIESSLANKLANTVPELRTEHACQVIRMYAGSRGERT